MNQGELFPSADLVKKPIIRCISLWQPWASLMACGAKTVETRGWDTHVRGVIRIHAAKSIEGFRELEHADPRAVAEMERALGLPFSAWRARLPLGAIVARGELVRTLPTPRALAEFPDELYFGNFAPGRWGHIYKNITPLDPIPCRGAQGFFFAEVNLPETETHGPG